MNNTIKDFFEIGAIKTGNFTLKSGKTSNLYCDMRQLFSYPKILNNIAKQISEKIDGDLICGVPMGAIPLATHISSISEKPMIVLRKSRKEYGLKKLIEGEYKKGQTVVVIEDVTTTGGSINECVSILNEEGLTVIQKFVIIDRREDRTNDIQSLITEQDILAYLTTIPNRVFQNKTAQKLWNIIKEKRTNICISVDLEKFSEIIELLEKVGDHICMVKIHWDIFSTWISYARIYKIAEEKNFLILDDRKYNDIDSIVHRQYDQSKKSNAVTLQPQFGQGTINGVKNSKYFKDNGIFLIAQSSAKDNLVTKDNTESVISLALENLDSVAGLITQTTINKKLLNVTPGIHLDMNGEGKQGYRTPDEAVSQGSDILIVGRGIYRAKNPLSECIRYKEAGWRALVERYN